MKPEANTRSQDYRVTFFPGDRDIRSLPGETLLDSARRAGVRIASVCGGRGLCRSCIVRICDGPAGVPSEQDSEFFSEAELSDNWRRACQCFPAGDCRVQVSERARAAPGRAQVLSEDVWVRPDPAVRLCRTSVPAPTLESPLADDVRTIQALNQKRPGAATRMDLEVQRHLSGFLRQSDGDVAAAVRFGEVIGLLPAWQKQPLPGLAVDIGTTNIGILLVDLRSGRTLSSCGVENPQVIRGGDVITRIGYGRSSSASLDDLRRLVVKGINEAAGNLCRECGVQPEEIADIVIAGNTAMHHLVMGLQVDQLGNVPFVAAVSLPSDVKARELGITAMPGAYVHLMPNIAGFVGGDHTSVLLAIGGDREKQTVIVLDIGTNTEISLNHDGRLSSVSCPSGPALEGGHIRCGMISAPGAIESVSITADGIEFSTIDDAPAVGICGSGVLDITAHLYKSGIVDVRGRMLAGHPRVRKRQGQYEFVLVEESEAGGDAVVFTQSDVRDVQLAKGAIRAGIRILLDDAGLKEEQIDQITIAGAFGNYIDLDSALAIGMLPDLPRQCYAQIGNAAAIGAKLALISHPHRIDAQNIAAGSRYTELATKPEFQSAFMKLLSFPKVTKNRSY